MEEKKATGEIVLILDKSGSMEGTESDTAGGFNALIEKQKAELKNAWVTTWLFNRETEILYNRVPIREIKPMKASDIVVGGNTALYDAVGDAIGITDWTQKYLIPKEEIPDFTLVAIMTDGYENASVHFSNHEIRELIEKKKADGWEFLFMAAGIDAKEEADDLAIPHSYQMAMYSAREAFCEIDRQIHRASKNVEQRKLPEIKRRIKGFEK